MKSAWFHFLSSPSTPLLTLSWVYEQAITHGSLICGVLIKLVHNLLSFIG